MNAPWKPNDSSEEPYWTHPGRRLMERTKPTLVGTQRNGAWRPMGLVAPPSHWAYRPSEHSSYKTYAHRSILKLRPCCLLHHLTMYATRLKLETLDRVVERVRRPRLSSTSLSYSHAVSPDSDRKRYASGIVQTTSA